MIQPEVNAFKVEIIGKEVVEMRYQFPEKGQDRDTNMALPEGVIPGGAVYVP